MAKQIIKFVSKYANLTRVIQPAGHLFENGRQVGYNAGKRAQFVEGKFETDDEKIIKVLKNTEGVWIDDGKTAEDIEKNEEKTSEDTQPKLESLTRQELLQLAKDKELEVGSKATKKELLELLKEK